MRFMNVFLLIFVLAILAMGAGLTDVETEVVDYALNNASIQMQNFELLYNESLNDSNLKGFYAIIEQFIQFAGTLAFEGARVGVHFGQENPQYFEPDFIIKIIRLLIWLAIISLAIQPAFYVLVFFVMCMIFMKDIIVRWRKRVKKTKKTSVKVLRNKESNT
ncbi:MAG: hypothetical protein ACTSQ4_02335 [Candidatus Heimdallarchaeaceae archaeon]